MSSYKTTETKSFALKEFKLFFVQLSLEFLALFHDMISLTEDTRFHEGFVHVSSLLLNFLVSDTSGIFLSFLFFYFRLVF